jgi:hypothetical protein
MKALLDDIQEIACLKPGGIYLLRAKKPFRTMEDFALAQACLDAGGEKVGCKFVLLDGDFELVKPVEDPPKATKATNIGTLTVRVTADTREFTEEMERIEQVVRRTIAATDVLKARVPSAS